MSRGDSASRNRGAPKSRCEGGDGRMKELKNRLLKSIFFYSPFWDSAFPDCNSKIDDHQ